MQAEAVVEEQQEAVVEEQQEENLEAQTVVEEQQEEQAVVEEQQEAEAVVEEQQEAEAVGVPRSAGARQGEPIWPSTNPVVGSQAAWDRRWMRPSISSTSLLMFSGSQE